MPKHTPLKDREDAYAVADDQVYYNFQKRDLLLLSHLSGLDITDTVAAIMDISEVTILRLKKRGHQKKSFTKKEFPNTKVTIRLDMWKKRTYGVDREWCNYLYCKISIFPEDIDELATTKENILSELMDKDIFNYLAGDEDK